MRKYQLIGVLFSLAYFITSCDKWSDHTKIESDLNTTLWQEINSNPDLSIFAAYLKDTGYDKLLQSSIAATVWAPNNEALTSLRPSLVSNPDSLSQLMSNHICYSQYFTKTTSVKIKMISGKNLTWSSDNFGGSGLLSTNKYTRNGVLHVINQAVVPKMNIWQYLRQSTEGLKHKGYLFSLDHEVFVDSLATQTAVDPFTGRPIYEPGTGFVLKNDYLDNVARLDNEDSTYTYILMTDDAYTAELTKLTPYFKGKVQSDSITLKSWHLVKDLAFNRYYSYDNLPGVLLSKWNVKVPIDKSAVMTSIPLSNGIVHVMKKVDFALRQKIDTIRVEGESSFSYQFLNNSGITVSGSIAYIHHRVRAGASNNMDLEVTPGYTSSGGVIVTYQVPVYSGTYEVYWTVYNNAYLINTLNATTGIYSPVLTNFSQRLDLDVMKPLASSTFPLVTVGLKIPTRVKLGQYTVSNYKMLKLYLISNYVTAAGAAINGSPLNLDNIELVPKLN